MNGPLANPKVLKQQKMQYLTQENRIGTQLWKQLNPEDQKQLAQLLAKMIQQFRQIPRLEKSRDERV